MQLSHLIIIGNHTKKQVYVVEKVLGYDMQPINTRYRILMNEAYTLQNPRWVQVGGEGYKNVEDALLELQRFDHKLKLYGAQETKEHEEISKKF